MAGPKSRIHRISWIPLAALLLWPGLFTATAAEPDRVLVLHSYHQGFEWTDALQAGIEKAFAESDRPVDFSVEYIDAKRHPGEILFHDLAGLFARKYERRRPKVILSCDDDALNFLFAYRDRLFPGVPVVFCGLNVEDYDPAILEGRSGYTGVVEKLDLASTIALIPRVQPEATRVVFVHDQTTTGLANRRMAEALAPRFADRLEFAFPEKDQTAEGDWGPGSLGGLSERELLAYLERLTSDTAVFFLGFYRDRFDAPLELEKILPKISRAAPVPVYGYVESYLGRGVLGGKLLSGEVHGSSVARKVLRIFRGEAVAEIPVTVESSNRFMFDDRQLRRFRIPKRRLPQEAILLHAPGSFLERHRVAIGWSLMAGLLVFLFFLILFFNMSRRLRAEARAASSERKYRLLADHSADVIWTMDAEHRLTYVSPSIEKLSGYTPEEFLNLSFGQWMTPQTLESARRRIAERGVNWDEVYRSEQEMIRKDGSVVWTEVLARGLRDERGRPSELVGSTRDITDRKRREETDRRATRREEAARRHQSLSTMAGAVAHNFNNLLMAVLGNLDMAMSDNFRFDRSRELIESAHESAMRAAGLSRLMLLYVGQGQDENEIFCLLEMIREQKASLRELAPPEIRIVFPPDREGEPCWIRGDRGRLAEAIRNLVINAAEAIGASAGEVVIGLERRYLTPPELEDNYGLKPPEEGRFVGLSVNDTGCGMSEETRRRLFEPYYTTQFTGRGLGLAVVLGIVRGHGGAIQVQGAEGAGSRITLFFPEVEPVGRDDEDETMDVAGRSGSKETF